MVILVDLHALKTARHDMNAVRNTSFVCIEVRFQGMLRFYPTNSPSLCVTAAPSPSMDAQRFCVATRAARCSLPGRPTPLHLRVRGRYTAFCLQPREILSLAGGSGASGGDDQ